MKYILTLILILGCHFKLSNKPVLIPKTYYKCNISVKGNNPFNLIYTREKWIGKIQVKTGRFEKFKTIELGLRAGIKLIHNYYYLQHITTVDSFINKYSPPHENNSNLLKKHLYNTVGKTIDSSNIFKLCKEVLWLENSINIDEWELKYLYNNLK